ncbi:MAG: DUF2336 domain-containing protein [Xanthobacteraceae bacterium]|nr:DUF2336 domain-containing protein [Xanthobacteraceae bacterium]
MKFTLALMSELEDALQSGAPERRVELLRRITDLFLNDANRLNEAQVGVFDEILTHLAHRIEERVLSQISLKLAPVRNAPPNMITLLASDDNIAVAGPVLAQSDRLAEHDLIEIAKSKGQTHLLAIAIRAQLSEAITDILIERGDKRVVGKLARNSGARFSQGGYEMIVSRADGDDELTENLGLRIDIPLSLLKQLLMRATNLVRSRLLASADPEKQRQIQEAMMSVAEELGLGAFGYRDLAAAENIVKRLNREGKLNERVLVGFAQQKKFDEVSATLSLFCGAPVDFVAGLLQDDHHVGLLVACKAGKMSWPTAATILSANFSNHGLSGTALEEAEKSYWLFSELSAQRKLQVMISRVTTKQAS